MKQLNDINQIHNTYFTGNFRLGDFLGFLKIKLLGVLKFIFLLSCGVAVIILLVGVANMVRFACLFPEKNKTIQDDSPTYSKFGIH